MVSTAAPVLVIANLNFEEIKSKIFNGNKILYKIDSNNYIRNILNNIVYPPAHFVWSSVFGYVNWHKAWRTDTFYIHNKVKEVYFKIMHRTHPVKRAGKFFFFFL